MADEEINGDTDDIQHDKDKTQKKTAKHDSGVADLEKVTDYAEEKEISSQDISGVSNRNLVHKIRLCWFATLFLNDLKNVLTDYQLFINEISNRCLCLVLIMLQIFFIIQYRTIVHKYSCFPIFKHLYCYNTA